MTWVELKPSRRLELISSTFSTLRIAASTRWVICVLHLARRGAGLRDGDFDRREFDVGEVVHVHLHERDMPASRRPTNSTIGGTGLRMHQEEMLRKFIQLTSCVRPRRIAVRARFASSGRPSSAAPAGRD